MDERSIANHRGFWRSGVFFAAAAVRPTAWRRTLAASTASPPPREATRTSRRSTSRVAWPSSSGSSGTSPAAARSLGRPLRAPLEAQSRDPERPVAGFEETGVADAVLLEGPARPVGPVGVELDDETLVGPDGVDFVAGHSRIDLRPR